MANQSEPSEAAAWEQLVAFFRRNGCMRVPDETRRLEEPRTYKMGYEIRLVARTKRELATMRRLIRAVGLKPGKPYAKASQWCQPIYGKSAMEAFQRWIDTVESD